MKYLLLLLLPFLQAKRLGGEKDFDRRQLDDKNGDKLPKLKWGDDGDFRDFNFGDLFDNNGKGDGGLIDWVNFDFSSFDFDNFNWDQITWDRSSWDEFLADMDFDNQNIDFCTIFEGAVGIGNAFGIAGNCACNGNITSDLDIGCSFSDLCVDESALCTTINVNYTMESNYISVGACVDFEYDTFPEMCFTYSFDITGQGSQTCGVAYDGNPCECEIEDFCLKLDCSMYLPGAAMDTCQILETIGGEDISTFLPDFPVFGENYTQTFENIPWETLSWEHLDTSHFKIDEIEWGNSAAEGRRFGDIINLDPNGSLLCPVLQTFIGMSDEFSSTGGCTCNEAQEGFSLDCSFDNACASQELCASVDLKFGFDQLGAVDTDTCVNFTNDVHPETCVGFEIPIASSASSPTCTVTYGGKDCKCTIDEDFCVSIDCSEYEPSAIASTCQDFSWGEGSAESFVPRFSLPGQDNGTVLTDEPDEGELLTGAGNDQAATDDVAATTETQLNESPKSGGGAPSSLFSVTLVMSLPFLLSLF
jgi:hypothetical protein